MGAFVVSSPSLEDRWDLKGARAAMFRARHPDFVPLGRFVKEEVETIRPFEEPEKEWPVYGVSNREGVFLSHLQRGNAFKSAYKRIEEDWFFHNPTRANVGSIGRVPAVPEDALTSPEYQVWSISDSSWRADYVEALIKLPFFNLLVHVHRVGAVKERLYTRNLMQIPVPNRPPPFQDAVVQAWRALSKTVQDTEARIAELEEALVAEVLLAAGISVNTPKPFGKAYASKLDTFERWGVGFNRHRWSLETLLSSTLHPSVPIEEVAFVNPRRTVSVADESLVSFVPMEAVSEVSGAIEGADEVAYSEVASGYTAFEERDVIWAKITPCMQNGKSAIAAHLKNGVGFGSTEFHVLRSKDEAKLLPSYLWVLLRLKAIREAAQRFFIGSAGQQRVPAEFLKQLHVPIPDVDAQKTIVAKVMEKRTAVAAERSTLAEARKIRLAKIEEAVVTGDLAVLIGTV